MIHSYESEASVLPDLDVPLPDYDQILNTATQSCTQNVQDTFTRGTQFKGFKPKRRSVSCQTRPVTQSKEFAEVQVDTGIRAKCPVDVGVQCSMQFAESTRHDVIMYPRSQVTSNITEEPMSDDDTSSYKDDDSDVEYEFSDEVETEEDENEKTQNRIPALEKKYILFESKLLSLFTICPSCHGSTSASIKQRAGSMITIHQDCTCGHVNRWCNQPSIGNIPAGNLLTSACILFSGSTPNKTLRFLNHMNIACISRRTYDLHQSMYLHPAVWSSFQDYYFNEMRRKRIPLNVGGDGRADTPGHSAKFGSYTIMDMAYMLVIDVQLVQSNEVKSSNQMELEGLKRGIRRLNAEQMNIGEMVTDRHIQINKYIREEMPNTTHDFDVWHVAKGMKKKLTAVSRLKDCEAITPWIQSISNHLYWVPVSTPDGHEETMVEKWTSLLQHVQNVHIHRGKHFQKCEHESLEGRERRKKMLQDILLSRQIMKDVRKLSPGAQTSCLEAFHSVVNHFAPKMMGFSYRGMHSRVLIAALHYNKNGLRDRAYRKDGSRRRCIIFPKYKKGEFSVRDIRVDCTYGYVCKLVDTLIANVESRTTEQANQQPEFTPPPLCSSYKRPRLDEVQKLTRY